MSAGSIRRSGRTDSAAAEEAFVSSPHLATLRNNLRSGERGDRTGISPPQPTPPPLFPSLPRASFDFFLGSAMGKEQELLEAARTGNLPAVEKLLSGKRQSAGGSSGTGGSGNSGGHGASSHPLSSLLR